MSADGTQATAPRSDAREVERALRAGHELHLVCAYETASAWARFGLERALSWQAFQALRPTLDPDARVVLYCRCPADRTAERLARRLAAEGLRGVSVLAGGFEAARVAGMRPARA